MDEETKKAINSLGSINYKGLIENLAIPKVDLNNLGLDYENNFGLLRPQDFDSLFLSNELDNLEVPENPTYKLIEKQEEANLLLGQIAENTSVLKELVQINRDTNLNVQELNDLMLDIYIIAKANSKEEAEGLFAKAIEKISSSGEKATNIASFVNIAIGIFNTVLTLI